jgi:fructose-bisphosphate aldolase class II
VRKINIDTDIRLAMTAAVRKFMFENPEKFDAARLAQARPRSRQTASASSATYEFGCEGQAPRSRATALSCGRGASMPAANWPKWFSKPARSR